MTAQSKWTEPPVLLGMVQICLFGLTILWALFGQLGSPNQLKDLKAELTSRMDQTDKRLSEGFDRTQAQISLIPDVGARLGVLERDMIANRAADLARDQRLDEFKAVFSVDHANLMAAMRDVQTLQDAINGKLPGRLR